MKANNVSRAAFLAKCAHGAFLHHVTQPGKQGVFIVSCIRSGSTLLKALLGAAREVSHFGESWAPIYPPRQYWPRLNFYASYADLCAMSRERIVVFKQPYGLGHYRKGIQYPDLPSWPVKVIVLFRNPEEVKASIKEIFRTTKRRPAFSDEDLSSFQHSYFRMIGDFLRTTEHDVFLATYSQLVSDPKTLTGEIFRFIGLQDQAGTDVYDQGHASWDWRTDDGGPLIRSLKVVSRPSLAVWRDPETFRKLSEAQTVMAFEELVQGWQSTSPGESPEDG